MAANMPSTAKNAHSAASNAARPRPHPSRAQTTAGTKASDKSGAAPSIPARESSRAVSSGPAPATQASSAVKPSSGALERPAAPKLRSWAARVSAPGAAPDPNAGPVAAPNQHRSQPQSPASTTQHAQHDQQPVRPAAQSAGSTNITHVQAEESSARQLTSSAPAEEAVQEGPAETSTATRDTSATAEKIKVGTTYRNVSNRVLGQCLRVCTHQKMNGCMNA